MEGRMRRTRSYCRAAGLGCLAALALAGAGCSNDVRTEGTGEGVYGFFADIGHGVVDGVGYVSEYAGRATRGVGTAFRDAGVQIRGDEPPVDAFRGSTARAGLRPTAAG